jgi:hypothetical protein
MRKDQAQRDLERGDAVLHAPGQCKQEAVNAMGVEKALEGRAAEDKTDEVYGEDEKVSSSERHV